MSLFKSKDMAAPPKDENLRFSLARKNKQIFTTGGSLSQLRESVGLLAPDTLIHYRTAGKWHRHQLITQLLTYTGPADLYMSTWSMSEDPVRALFMLKQKEQLLSANLVISERINERTPEVMQLARNIFNRIAFKKLHAKITVLIGNKAQVCAVGSDNLTRNPKDEAGVIDTNIDSVQFRLKQLTIDLEDGRALK